jgi:hypothetical protein
MHTKNQQTLPMQMRALRSMLLAAVGRLRSEFVRSAPGRPAIATTPAEQSRIGRAKLYANINHFSRENANPRSWCYACKLTNLRQPTRHERMGWERCCSRFFLNRSVRSYKACTVWHTLSWPSGPLDTHTEESRAWSSFRNSTVRVDRL